MIDGMAILMNKNVFAEESAAAPPKVEARWRMAEELNEMGDRVMDEYDNVVNGYVLITKQRIMEVSRENGSIGIGRKTIHVQIRVLKRWELLEKLKNINSPALECCLVSTMHGRGRTAMLATDCPWSYCDSQKCLCFRWTKINHFQNSDPNWLLDQRQRIIRNDLLTRLLRVTERLLRQGADGARAAGALTRAVCDAVSVDAEVADDVASIREQLQKVVASTPQRVHREWFGWSAVVFFQWFNNQELWALLCFFPSLFTQSIPFLFPTPPPPLDVQSGRSPGQKTEKFRSVISWASGARTEKYKSNNVFSTRLIYVPYLV